ncbi:MAG: ATP12 family protein [Pseudomonadota bacterium]|nr:ATP12 family protein [Pseudomonadota bacterium]
MSAKTRFYKSVSLAEEAGGLAVRLDGRTVKTPAGTPAFLPSRALAEAVAGEWDAQGEEIDAGSMPVFSLAVTVIDRVTPQRAAILDELTAYGGNDLICYQDGEDAELAARQAEGWGPWLDWARSDLGAPLQVARSIMPVMQPQASLDALAAAAAAHDDWELGMLYRATTLGGSLVLGLAMLRGRMDSEGLFTTAFLDELWQAEKWGSDWEAEDRRAMIRGELDQAHRFLGLLRAAGDGDA